METIIRTISIYVFLLIVMRIGGRRTIAEMSQFDFILLLIISEGVQQGIIANDYSLTNAFIVVFTLIGVDMLFTRVKLKSKWFENLISGIPMILVDEGKPLKDHMEKAGVDEDDILEAARELQGLERMEQIKYAVFESNGKITVVLRSS